MTHRFLRALGLAAGFALASATGSAMADTGAVLPSAATLSVTASAPDGYQTAMLSGFAQAFGSNGSTSFPVGSGVGAGTFGGVSYLATYTFQPQFAGFVGGGPFAVTEAGLSLVGPTLTANNAPSVPLTFSLYTGSDRDPLTISNYGALHTQTAYQAILQSTTPLGTYTATPGGTINTGFPNLASAVQNAMTSGNSLSGPLTLVVTAGGAGVGTPAPIAGAGLPVLAAAGLLLARRRRAARMA